MSQPSVTLSFGGVDGTGEEEEAVGKVSFTPTVWWKCHLYLQEHHADISPSALFTWQTQCRAQCCCSFSHSCVPLLSAWRHAAAWLPPSTPGFGCSLSEITQTLEGGSSLPTLCHHPSSHVQSQVQRTLYGQIVCCPHQHYFPYSSSSGFVCLALLPRLRECVVVSVAVWVCTIKQCKQLSLDPRSFCFPWGYCWTLFLLTWTRVAARTHNKASRDTAESSYPAWKLLLEILHQDSC